MGRCADISHYSAEENAVWNAIAAIPSGQQFRTSSGLPYSLTVRGNELVINRKRKTVTRSTVMHAYRRVMQLRLKQIVIAGPKQLGEFGASYSFPIFRKIGVI